MTAPFYMCERVKKHTRATINIELGRGKVQNASHVGGPEGCSPWILVTWKEAVVRNEGVVRHAWVGVASCTHEAPRLVGVWGRGCWSWGVPWGQLSWLFGPDPEFLMKETVHEQTQNLVLLRLSLNTAIMWEQLCF